MKAFSFLRVKEFNRLLVLNHLHSGGPLTRKDIAERTGLAISAVTNVVNDLLEKNLVCVRDAGPSEGGRPPSFVAFNARSASVIGINVGYSKIMGVRTDLQGTIVARAEEPTGEIKASQDVLKVVSSLIRDLQKPGGTTHVPPVAGVGVGVPGLVDALHGVSVFSPNFGWENVSIKDQLAATVDLPILVDNDVRLATFGEWKYGAGVGVEQFASLFVGSAIGAGFVINGALHYGGTQTAGEIGHTVVDPDGPRCSCGKYGCLEAAASGRAIVSGAVAELRRGRASSLTDTVAGKLDLITAKMVAEQAARGDGLSMEVMERCGRYLGAAVATLANIVNPQVVAVGGGVSGAGSLIMEPLLESFQHQAVRRAGEATKIVLAQLGKDAGPLGAAGRVVQKLLHVSGGTTDQFPTLLEMQG